MYDSGVHPDWQSIVDLACNVCPIEFTLTDGVRTAKKQFSLFKIGRIQVPGSADPYDPDNWKETGGGVVTYCDGFKKKSKHQKKNGYGMAIDLCAYIKGRPDLRYDRVHMAAIIGSFLTCAMVLHGEGRIDHILRSGADWDRDTEWLEPGTFIDLPHLELIKP